MFLISFIFVLLWFLGSFLVGFEFAFIGLVLLFFPLLFVFSKAVEESCMVKKVYPKDLTEGDWLYEDLYIKGNRIKKKWRGISKEELRLIRRKYNRKVMVKYGVPFTPSFLIGLIGLLYLDKIGWF